MRICKTHWAACRKAIEDRGMSALIAPDGETATENAVADLKGEADPENKRFDPLMSMNWHWSRVALSHGGLSLMTLGGPPENDGHFCPLCEMASHYADFTPEDQVASVADQMLAWARAEGLVPRPS